MQLTTLPATTTRHFAIQCRGGLDLITPQLELKPGYVRDALNWEQSINGGYARIQGYERFDGRAAPSAAVYLTVTVNQTGAIAVGNTITGATSAATGKVLAVDTSSGHTVVSYTQSTGAFVVGENITISAAVVASVLDFGGRGASASYDATQRAAAANVYRALIGAVPGSGPVRGGFFLAGNVYAFRNNAGGTALVLHKATGSGWTAVTLGLEVAFTAGSSEYAVGETLTQGGVSALIRAVALQSGTWAGTAAGRLVIDAPTGGNFAAGAAVGGGAATLSGIQTQIALLPGGRVQTDLGNFGTGVKVYGCDGVNRGFQFDGTVFVPITTGNAADMPDNVLVHKDHLWFSFDDNLQNSGITTPFNWTALAGSAAFRCNGNITALLRQPGNQAGGAMSIATETGTEMIYGNSAADFQKMSFEQSAGARLYGAQRLGGQSVVWGNTGVFALTATQAYGNFAPASLTMNIRPYTQARRTTATASLTSREKSQYRVFFADGSGLYMTLANGRHIGTMPISFPNLVFSAWQGDAADGSESSYLGATNGFVYRLDAGTSFDGAPIASYLTLPHSHQSGPRTLNRYRRASFEVQGQGYAEFSVTYEVGYGGPDRPQGVIPSAAAVALAAVYWDAFTWDNFTWDGKTLGPTTLELGGTGENIALRIASTSDLYSSLTINSIVLDYSVRRGLRQ